MKTLKTKTITEKYLGITNTYKLIYVDGAYKVLDGINIIHTSKGFFSKLIATIIYNKQK